MYCQGKKSVARLIIGPRHILESADVTKTGNIFWQRTQSTTHNVIMKQKSHSPHHVLVFSSQFGTFKKSFTCSFLALKCCHHWGFSNCSVSLFGIQQKWKCLEQVCRRSPEGHRPALCEFSLDVSKPLRVSARVHSQSVEAHTCKPATGLQNWFSHSLRSDFWFSDSVETPRKKEQMKQPWVQWLLHCLFSY